MTHFLYEFIVSRYLDATRDWGNTFVVVAPDVNQEELLKYGEEGVRAGWAAKWGMKDTHREMMEELVRYGT
jgi:hypothetical protein